MVPAGTEGFGRVLPSVLVIILTRLEAWAFFVVSTFFVAGTLEAREDAYS